MASKTEAVGRRSAIATVIILAVLTALLLLLAVIYYILSRPATFGGDAETQAKGFLFSIYGNEGDLLRRPNSATIDAQGNIHVADTGKRRIVVFDADGKFLATYGDPGQGTNQLWAPLDVAVAADGRSYVVDKTLDKIIIYDRTRLPVREIVFEDEPPSSVTVSGDELIVTTGSGVLIGNLDGDLLTGYIARGKEPGQFDRPAKVAVGEDGTLYVADSLNYRVQAIGTDGSVLWTYGEPLPADEAIQFDSSERKFGLPASIAADEAGRLYVVDGLSSELLVFDTDGTYIEQMSDIGHGDGELYYPAGIGYGDGRIVVADKFNDRVSVFGTPAAVGIVDRGKLLLPWLIGLALLPVILILLLRQRSRYVATPSFLVALTKDERGDEVASALKRALATEALAERFGDIEGLSLLDRIFDEDRVRDLVDRYALERADAEALDIALSMKGKSGLLTEDEALISAAVDIGVTTVTYGEMLRTLGLAAPSEEGEVER